MLSKEGNRQKGSPDTLENLTLVAKASGTGSSCSGLRSQHWEWTQRAVERMHGRVDTRLNIDTTSRAKVRNAGTSC